MTPESAKIQLAHLWRQHHKVRDPDMIDEMTRENYERLYNIQQGDVWDTMVMDLYMPRTKVSISSSDGYSTLDQDRNEGKSEFLTTFLEGSMTQGTINRNT